MFSSLQHQNERSAEQVEKSTYGKKYMGVQRSTFIIDGKGKVVASLPKVQPKKHDDLVLKAIAARVRRVVRSDDMVARYGGDEFAVLLNGIGDEAALHGIIAKITQAVALPINLGSCHVRIGSSIGMAVYPDHGEDPASLLTHADKAMYSAKRSLCKQALSSQT